ncbi:MAG: ABC transporter ATP-binding protein, partial [Erysipelotrichaceae bacterium]|nr:ABC transporter ATP-binding protein [Erysipelotrichaceae bacterium]
MLSIKNLTKKYGDFTAVDDLSLEINPGEICGFIGHNGAGKTTTIRCCCGLLDFEAGEILINGKNVREDPVACKRDLAYIPDNPTLFEYLSGIQYLNFVADIYGIDKQTREEKISKYSEYFELKKDLAMPISSYSHGMKQKLAIISALIHDPKLIILDEPFVGLDPIASFRFKEVMREICANGGAVFFSTHVLDVAEKLCDRIAIIRKGKLIRYGTLEEVKGDESLEETFLELEQDHA